MNNLKPEETVSDQKFSETLETKGKKLTKSIEVIEITDMKTNKKKVFVIREIKVD
jgi:DNA transposition AAA+ family ATPase